MGLAGASRINRISKLALRTPKTSWCRTGQNRVFFMLRVKSGLRMKDGSTVISSLETHEPGIMHPPSSVKAACCVLDVDLAEHLICTPYGVERASIASCALEVCACAQAFLGPFDYAHTVEIEPGWVSDVSNLSALVEVVCMYLCAPVRMIVE